MSPRSRTFIGLSSTAIEQLKSFEERPPEGWYGLAESIVDQIETHIASWLPLSERGGDGIIKWCDKISLHCNADVYRLKNPEIGEWRIFFFLLDLDKPPTRHVADIVEWKNNEQCYNDMTQPHVKRIRLLTTQFKNAGRLRLMR